MDTVKLDNLIDVDEVHGMILNTKSSPDNLIDRAEEILDNIDTEAKDYLQNRH